MKRRPKFDPTLPLRNVRYESFARARAAMERPLRAMELAGYDKPTTGNAARLDRHPHIIARLRHFALSDNSLELLTLRRNRLRSMYETMALADRTKVFEEIDVPEYDENGNAILIDGKPLMKTVRRLRSFDKMTDDERMLIEGLDFDGDKYKTKLVCRLACMKALREIDSLDGPERLALTDEYGKALGPIVPVINISGHPNHLNEKE